MKIIKQLLTIILVLIVIDICFVMDGNSAYAVENDHKQATCPVMGGKINPEYYVDVEGKRIYVCCPGCIDIIKRTPQNIVKK